MNKNLTIETYSHINSTLETLRNAIMYINHDETVEVLLKHHDAMQRMIDDESIPFGTDFNYDLDAMKIAVESPIIKVPKQVLDSFEEFDEWLHQDDEKLSGDE